jgi:GNAT superfamily N-acetyltransferase
MPIRFDDDVAAVDWVAAKTALAADDFDNGRSPDALERSFAQSQHVVFAWDTAELVGMGRMLSDGVCNAYLLDVWTSSSHRRQGIGTQLVRRLVDRVPGQHVGLQTDDGGDFYAALGFVDQPSFWSTVSGTWLDNHPS